MKELSSCDARKSNPSEATRPQVPGMMNQFLVAAQFIGPPSHWYNRACIPVPVLPVEKGKGWWPPETHLREELRAGLEGLQIGPWGEIFRQLLCQVLQHVQGTQGRLCDARGLGWGVTQHPQHEAGLRVGGQLLELAGVDVMEVLDQGVVQTIRFQQEIQHLQGVG